MAELFRTENDSLGEKKIPSRALYGIHSVRATENFPVTAPFPEEWYRALGIVKLSCYTTYGKFVEAAKSKYGEKLPFRLIDKENLESLSRAAEKVSAGIFFDSFIVPAVQGGAGTSINMNINEIIANSALSETGHEPGDYNVIDPIEDANIYQSTNDVIPTSLTVCVMSLLNILEDSINALRQKFEELERKNRDKLRLGYTQMQAAVPASFGTLFGSYNEALSRDWWRVSKCFERIKQVNLGGGAIGTGISQPRYFIMEVVPELRNRTGLPLAHSENLADATSNLDKWVEIHATLKAHAINLEKIVADIRLLSSDIAGDKIITIPEKQVGSSIMPGKINPVIPEFVISAAHKVYSNDMLISSLCALGTLELNPYLPVTGTAIIESIKLLTACNETLLKNLLEGMIINEDNSYKALMNSPAISTALTPYVGYHTAARLSKYMKEQKCTIFEANDSLKIIDNQKLKEILEPGNLMKLGFSLSDIPDNN